MNGNLGAAGSTLTLNGGALQWSGPFLQLPRPIVLGASGGTIDMSLPTAIVELTGLVSGPGGLLKTGPGILSMTGANTYAGGTTVLGGLISVAGGGPLGPGPLTLNGGGLQATANATLGAIALAGPGVIETFGASTALNVGAISGPGALTKQGPGVLHLTAPATYAGATAVTAGTLRAGAANVFSAGSAHTVNAGTTLALNNFNQTLNSLGGPGTVSLGSGQLTLATAGAPQSFGGAITGTGGVTVSGTGSLTITGAQTYTGSTIVSGGSLTIPGSLASSVVNVTGGSLAVAGGAAMVDAAALTVNAPGTAAINGSETIGSLSGTGAVTLATGSVLTVGAGASTTFSGALAGGGGLSKAGAGTLTLSGPKAYTGPTTVSAGTLAVQGPLASSLVQMSGGALQVTGSLAAATVNVTGGNFTASGGNAIADAAALTVTAPGTAAFNTSETLGSIAGTGAMTLASGTVLSVNGTGTTSYSGIISGAGGLTKGGSGSLTLAGAQTYSGPTVVSGGTLAVGGSLASTPVQVAGGTLNVTGTISTAVSVSSGTLRGSGSVNGAALTGGQIQPGSIFTVNGNLNVGAGASLATAINGTSPATDYGQVRVNGTVTLAGTLNATVGTGFTPTPGSLFVIIDNDGTDAVSGTFAGLAEGAAVTVGPVTFTISYAGGSGNDVVLSFASVVYRTYLAEGATNAFFDVRIALVNPSATDTANVTMRFLTSVPSTITHTLSIPPLGRRTVNPETDVAGLADANFSTVVESNVGVVVDRTMSWDAGGYGSHAETSSGAPATIWYFAEGATHGQFDLFYLLQNATPTAADVEITYLLPSGPLAPRTYQVPGNSRVTIYVDQEPGLDATDVSAIIRVTNGVPISTERAMYVSTAEQVFAAGTDVAGIAAPSTSWFFAEGATGPFFDFFLLLANPQSTAADVSITYVTSGGDSVTKSYAVAGNSRRTISVQQEDPRLDNAAIAATVTSTNAVPILAERAIFWPAFPWYEGHASAGVTATGTRWALADGEAGGAADTQTYILLANTGSSAATVRVTLLLEAGGTLQREFAIPANSRFNVNAGADFPNAMNQRFGALVESVGATPQPIVVERSMYTNAGGVIWAAGTNALATRLQ
jgi:autotransporter-associated beta strand protein